MDSSEESSLIPPREVARLLGISTDTIRTWRCAGKHIPGCYEFSGRYRYSRQEVLAYRERCRIDLLKSVEV